MINFFHCKANYEATSREAHGEAVAKKLSNLRESFDMHIKGDSPYASIQDQIANARGRTGAKVGKSLKETCPTHYKKYD